MSREEWVFRVREIRRLTGFGFCNSAAACWRRSRLRTQRLCGIRNSVSMDLAKKVARTGLEIRTGHLTKPSRPLPELGKMSFARLELSCHSSRRNSGIARDNTPTRRNSYCSGLFFARECFDCSTSFPAQGPFRLIPFNAGLTRASDSKALYDKHISIASYRVFTDPETPSTSWASASH